MKITNAEVIKSGERELIDTIISDLDWGSIEQLVKDKHKLSIQDDVEYKKGDLVVHNNKIAYKLDFEVKMTLSVVFDRDGNYLSIATSADTIDTDEEASPLSSADPTNDVLSDQNDDEPFDRSIEEDELPSINPESEPKENYSKMASHIADMISDINENDD